MGTADNHGPPPPQTKVTTVGRNENYIRENLIGPQGFGSQTPHPLSSICRQLPSPVSQAAAYPQTLDPASTDLQTVVRLSLND